MDKICLIEFYCDCEKSVETISYVYCSEMVKGLWKELKRGKSWKYFDSSNLSKRFIPIKQNFTLIWQKSEHKTSKIFESQLNNCQKCHKNSMQKKYFKFQKSNCQNVPLTKHKKCTMHEISISLHFYFQANSMMSIFWFIWIN